MLHKCFIFSHIYSTNKVKEFARGDILTHKYTPLSDKRVKGFVYIHTVLFVGDGQYILNAKADYKVVLYVDGRELINTGNQLFERRIPCNTEVVAFKASIFNCLYSPSYNTTEVYLIVFYSQMYHKIRCL